MFVLSTKQDVKCHEVDLENVSEDKSAVSTWIRRLTPSICRKRMEHYFELDLEASSRSTLLEFRDLFESYEGNRNAKTEDQLRS
jgi:hypothetical protein